MVLSMMTREEYDIWIQKMKLLGELERMRREQERSTPLGLKQFLIFLDDLHSILRQNRSAPTDDLTMTNIRIARQKLLAKFPKR